MKTLALLTAMAAAKAAGRGASSALEAYENSDAAKARRLARLAAARAVINAYPEKGTYEQIQEAMNVLRREEARLAAQEASARAATAKKKLRQEELARFAATPEGAALAHQRHIAEEHRRNAAKTQAAAAAHAVEKASLAKLDSARKVLTRPEADVPATEWKFALATIKHYARPGDHPGEQP
jgi:hypothetical protein